MANTNVADVITWIATQVAATTPPVATAPVDASFVRATPLETFEPNGSTIYRGHDRQFEIRLTSRREAETFGASSRQVEQGFEIEVMYMVSLSRAELDARMGRDAEAIENRLANLTGNPTGVRLVLARGASFKRNHAHPDVRTMVLSFTVLYQLATT